jgi:hypothetical protein
MMTRGRHTFRHSVVMCVLVSWLTGRPASADILLESHRIERPADADRILAPLRDELVRAGVKVQPVHVVEAAAGQLPLPGTFSGAFGAAYPADANGQVDLGTKEIFRGDYEGGLAILDAVLQGARSNSDLVVADASATAWLTKAYAAIAFAHLRSRRLEAATEAIAEQIRSFPEHPIGRSLGPEVASLADSVRKALDSEPRGTLRISVSQPDVRVFVNERARGTQRWSQSLLPGVYRVLLVSGGVSRRYSARVTSGGNAELQIDWDADARFHATPSWIGFAWPRDEDDKTAAAVERYARREQRHDIYVASLAEQGQRRFVTGAVFDKRTGMLRRDNVIELGRDDGACARALAQHLLRGLASPCLIGSLPGAALRDRGDVAGREEAAGRSDPFAVSGVVAGLGALSVFGGITVLTARQDPPGGQPSPTYFSGPGVGLLVAGAAAIGTAVYLTSRSSQEAPWRMAMRRSRAPLFVAAGTALGAFAAGGYLLHINGEPTCAREGECYFRYRSAPLGWALIASGAVAAGLGLYWQLSTPGDSRSPTVVVAPTGDGAVAGLAGRF